MATPLAAQALDEAEHVVSLAHRLTHSAEMRGVGVMFVEELDDVEAALVDVEVDVAHLEIGRHQGPFPHLRVGGLDGEPGARPHSPGMNRGLHCEKENLASMPDDGEDHVAHDFAVLKDAIGERSRRIQGLLNVGQWENRLRRCTALAGTSRRLLTRGETLPPRRIPAGCPGSARKIPESPRSAQDAR